METQWILIFVLMFVVVIGIILNLIVIATAACWIDVPVIYNLLNDTVGSAVLRC